MARLVLPQFKQVDASGLEVDRSLDLEDIDEAFSRVAKTVNGNLGPGNLKNGMLLSSHIAPGAIPNAWRESASVVTFFAQKVARTPTIIAPSSFVLANIPSVGTWIPRSLIVLATFDRGEYFILNPFGALLDVNVRVTVSAPGYLLATNAVMKRVEPAVTEKKYRVVDDYPNTEPKQSFSSVRTGDLYRLYLVNSDQGPLAPLGADGHLLGGTYPDGSTFGLPAGQPITVTFDKPVKVASASLSCLTPHLS